MKSRFVTILLLTMLLVPTFTACGLQTLDNRLDAVEDVVEEPLDTMEDAVENAFEAKVTPEGISQAEAETIALEHAGFSTDQILALRTEYDIDDGISKYEVQFYQDYWEYEYDIHAETGAILSFDKDN